MRLVSAGSALSRRAAARLGYRGGLPRVHPEEGIGIAHEDGILMGWTANVFKLMMHETIPPLFKIMQKKGQRVIVDVDDAHFALHEENVAFHSTNPHANPESNRMYY